MLLHRNGSLYWFIVLVVLFIAGQVNYTANAQSFLPLQPNKLRYAQKVLLNGLQKNDSATVAEACYLFGKTYVSAGDYRTAQVWFMKALRIREQLGDSEALTKVYCRLFDMEMAQSRWNNARRYATQALQIAERIGSARARMQAYSALAHVYDVTQASQRRTMPLQADSAFLYLKKVAQLAQRLHDTVQIAYIESKYGDLMSARNDSRAITYYKKGLAMYARLNLPGEQIWMNLALVKAYLQIDKPTLAILYLTEARQLHTKLNLNQIGMRLGIENASLQYYRAVGDWRQAFRQLDIVRTLEESKFTADRAGAISRLNVEFETEKKEALLKSQQTTLALNAENQRIQQRFLVAVSVFLAMAIVVGLVLFRLYQQNRRISQRNAELVREQNHRVKNNLQVLSSLLSLQANRMESETARQAIEASQLRVETMALLQRRLYDGDRLATVLLPDFLPELVRLILQTFGYEDIETEFAIEPVELGVDTALRVGLIVNELTTNACKYAFADHPDPQLRLSVIQKKQELTLTVADNGPGHDWPGQSWPGLPSTHRTEPSPRSFGLRLIQMQVAQLNGSYAFSNNNGTHFSMHFTTPNPLLKQEGALKPSAFTPGGFFSPLLF